MAALTNKIDFALVISVTNANPNGDPLDGNRPRTTFDGRGEISDVCLKRKIRNRLLDMGQPVYVQSDDKRNDPYRSLKERADSVPELVRLQKDKDKEGYSAKACETWFDVRAFGQVFAFSKGDDASGTSIPIRGPVTIQSAFTINPVDITSIQITKSVNLETNEKNPDQRGSDTMGMKHRVDKGIYVTYGSINVQLAEKTGFSDADAEILKEAMRTLFVNDVSSARPDGSMEVKKLIWWRHNCKNGQYSSAQVHRSLNVDAEGNVTLTELPGLEVSLTDGL
jgi:CRISPR-associated protein Csd2